MDKRRLHREILKQALFNAQFDNIPVKKEIIVDLRYLDNEWWPNYGYVQILSDGPDGYSSFSTHEENPLQYAKNRMNDKDSLTDYSKYKLIIKE